MPEYKYDPLWKEDIRLITVLPGKFGETIRVTVSHVLFPEEGPVETTSRLSLKQVAESLPEGWMVRETLEGRYLFVSTTNNNMTTWTHPNSNMYPKDYAIPLVELGGQAPSYEALSYTWGENAPVHRAYVSDEDSSLKTSDEYFQIRSNLECALQHIRYPDRSRTLWIDAICINQTDTAETEAQIKRMKDIYQRASRVLIWFGPEQDFSSLAIQTLRYLGTQVEHSADGCWGSPNATEPGLGDPKIPLPYTRDVWNAWSLLLSRSYFERLWIVQEARLARLGVIRCGFDSLPWNIFRRAVLTLRENTTKPPAMSAVLERVRDLCNSRFQTDFFRLMNMSRHRECADSRDKLYGILSLITPQLSRRIRPRYDLDVGQVYRDATSSYYALFSRLDLLSQCNSQTRLAGSPTWVPNWSQKCSSWLESTYFSAAAGLSCASYEMTSSGELAAVGVQSGRVVAKRKALEDNYHGLHQIFQQFVNLEKPPSYTSISKFLNLVFGGGTRERYPTNQSYVAVERVGWDYLVSEDSRSVNLENLSNLSFIATSTGLRGLGTTRTEPGDIITVLLGCHMAIILRPSTSDGQFEVIGPCLIHGLLDAEAFLGPLPWDWKVEFYRDSLGYADLHFRNVVTEELTVEDPRLGPLPSEWERVQRDRTQDDPRWFAGFRNLETGNIINSDPRMMPEALRARGVDLETFRLI